MPTIKAEKVTKRVFKKDLMSDVIDAMTYPVEGGTARYVGENLNRPAAGKTGTSESFRSAWFDGYVPQLQAAVGLFRSGKDGEELAMEDLPNAAPVADVRGTRAHDERATDDECAAHAHRRTPDPDPVAVEDERQPQPGAAAPVALGDGVAGPPFPRVTGRWPPPRG